jgi:hypothetical protein
MATIVNTPGTTREGSGTGLIVGVLLAIVLIALFFIYGLPAIRGTGSDAGTTVNIPENVDVNVQGLNPANQ